MDKKDIKDLTLEELKKEIMGIGEPAFRATQIFFWLYQKGVSDFGEMANIPKELRDKLDQNYYISTLQISEHLKSTDRTEKFLFKLQDGNFIESVLIYAKNRETICLSTQVGCKFACSFCASGFNGFVRNLTPSEIINQIVFLRHNLKHKITNCVFMGMGEPLDNYVHTSKAIMIMNDPRGMGIGARRITISTCGIIPGIKKLKNLGLQVNLSLSLHATNNKLRDALMPVNKRYPLEKLVNACEEFIEATGRMITLEYILIRDMNDSLKDADELAKIAKKLNAKVNLVPCSTISNPDFKSTRKRNINIFMNRLIKRGVNATLRESKGKDIQAACGQLAGRKKDEIQTDNL
jgi:23S rRNA (adenine2503-C2)-methyltransferase